MTTPPEQNTGRRWQRRGLIAAAVASAVGGGWLARRHAAPQSAADAAPQAAAEQSLWSLNFDTPDGGKLAMASLRGKPLLVNFWATWCAPCVRELPQIDRFHQQYTAQGWQVVGLAIDGPTPVREFLGRVKVGFPIGLAGLDGSELARGLGNDAGGLPFSVLFDAQGRAVQRKLGETHYDELVAWANALTASPATGTKTPPG